MNSRFRRSFNWLLDLIFPTACAACRAPLKDDEAGNFLCATCTEKLIAYRTFLCGACGARLPEFRKICHQDTPFLLAPAARYAPPVSEWITSLKFNRVRGYARPLGKLMSAYLMDTGFDLSEYVITPMPLYKTRERERGFNQAAEIAIQIAAAIKIPLVTDRLFRNRPTLPQTSMKTFADRAKNVEDAFRGGEKAAHEKIILVDDVFTSGKTAAAAARALKDAGARNVIVAVAAKTV